MRVLHAPSASDAAGRSDHRDLPADARAGGRPPIPGDPESAKKQTC